MAQRNIRLTGPEWEPRSPNWATAPEAQKRRYWTRLGEIAVSVKRDEIRRGRGVDGRKFAPVQPASRPDGADGAPLDPHYAESRTYRLLHFVVHSQGVTVYWKGHGRKSWTTILGYHADGLVRGAPVRDTIGISAAGQRKIKDRAATFWRTMAGETRRRTPTPGPAPTPTAPQTPTPAPRVVGHVVYLPAGAVPRPNTRHTQVYSTGPTPPPAPPRATPPPAPRPRGLRPALSRPAIASPPAGPTPPPAPPSFGSSTATVQTHASQTLPQALRHAKALLGRRVTATDLANLAGAADGATVEARYDPLRGVLHLETRHPDYVAFRELKRDASGKPIMYNAYFRANSPGGGLGVKVFGRQVEHAAQLGVSRIEVTAAGDPSSPHWNGYYTWPRFGYDAPLKYAQSGKLPPGLAGAGTVNDLMRSDEGRQWWKAHGDGGSMTFDLSPGSRSLQTWHAYLAEKANAKTP